MRENAGKLRGAEIYQFLIDNNIQIRCPSCGSRAFVRGGYNTNGNVRLICKLCKTGFMATANTLFEGTIYSLQEMITVIYDMATPILDSRSHEIYSWKRSNSKKWLMIHKILTIAYQLINEISFNEYNYTIGTIFIHKGVHIEHAETCSPIPIFISSDNCYLSRGVKQIKRKLNKAQKIILQRLTSYLTHTKRSISTKYLPLYISWFSFVINYAKQHNITNLTLDDAKQILIILTKYSTNRRISSKLRTLVAR